MTVPLGLKSGGGARPSCPLVDNATEPFQE